MAKVITRFSQVGGGMLVTVGVVPEEGDSEKVKNASEFFAGKFAKDLLEEFVEEITDEEVCGKLKEANVDGQPN